jgi:hypothetical protein
MYVTAQVMFIMSTIAALYSSFQTSYPSLFLAGASAAISYAKFKELKPWNARKCKSESCLCQTCENFGECSQCCNNHPLSQSTLSVSQWICRNEFVVLCRPLRERIEEDVEVGI